jgi:hypothetical protein
MFAGVLRCGRLAAVTGVCAAGLLAAAGASAGAATAPQQARVPWAQVGRGWELVQDTNGTPAKHAAAALYLISPGGAQAESSL